MVLEANELAPNSKVFQSPGEICEKQKWEICQDGIIKSTRCNLCLDIDGMSTSDGTDVILWPLTGGANQKWRFIES